MNTNKEYILQKESAVKPIYSITPFTLLDFPDKTACILWFAGCNMRCLYCYNPDIVLGKGRINCDDALKFIRSRKGLLDGVVFSGGECTLHKQISSLALEIKQMGMLVKIDTNGSNPKEMEAMLQNKLIDYVALDFKGTPNSFQKITQSDLFQQFETTLTLLIQSNVPFEVRTTVHSELINEKDLIWMQNYLETKGYKGQYYMQHAMKDVVTLGNLKNNQKTTTSLKWNTVKEANIIIRN